MKKTALSSGVLGVALWATLMFVLVFPHNLLTLTNAPVVLILASSIYSLLLPLGLSLGLSAVAVLTFNYHMVPPVHTLHVDLHEHGILLITMMGVSWLITYLLRRQEQIAAQERDLAQRTLRLMQWSETLREADEPQSSLPELHRLVQNLAAGCRGVVTGFEQPLPDSGLALTVKQAEAFKACLNDNKPLGKHTGRYDNLDDLYLPMRGKSRAYGVCVCLGVDSGPEELAWVRDAQALLDQMGLACERRENLLRVQQHRELEQIQKTRSLFLTSIAHDQRTPLASIMTSATAILQHAEQLSIDDIRSYAALIKEESEQVARLTDNTLTLARLSGDQVEVPMQPESAEDMVGAVLQRLRKRGASNLPKVSVQGGLPLVNCNMVLVEQVLDNLLDNAFKHSGAPESVALSVTQAAGELRFEVTDEGGGMKAGHEPGDHSRGLGIGLKLCEAVAHFHSGRLDFQARPAPNKGLLACFALPLKPAVAPVSA